MYWVLDPMFNKKARAGLPEALRTALCGRRLSLEAREAPVEGSTEKTECWRRVYAEGFPGRQGRAFRLALSNNCCKWVYRFWEV